MRVRNYRRAGLFEHGWVVESRLTLHQHRMGCWSHRVQLERLSRRGRFLYLQVGDAELRAVEW